MARGRHVITRVRNSPRETEWLFVSMGSSTFAGTAGGTLLGSLNAAALALRPFTIVRTHVEIQITSDQSAAIENQAGAYGMAVVSDQAAAFLHKIFYGDESNLTDRSKGGTRVSIDSKAMRRVNPDQDLVIVAEASTTGSGFFLLHGGRILIKLH